MRETIFKILLTFAVIGFVLGALPSSPFENLIATLEQMDFIGWLNWFLPIGRMVTVLGLWASAISTYYGISWILRQLSVL